MTSDWAVEKGLDLLGEGRKQEKRARYLTVVPDPLDEAEPTARKALSTLRSAMNWLEFTDHFEAAHAALDDTGRFTRETFGCHLTWREDQYWQECPVALAHNRVGMSPAMVIGRAECSICRSDPEDCEHITGRTYDGEMCVRVIAEVRQILEVSMVGRPAQPDARLMAVSLGVKQFRERFGAGFVPGAHVNCDRCLYPCDGVSRPFE